jgi:DNA-3-methyladenine glycosylase
MSILKRDFYSRNTLTVAKDLLGCKISRKLDGKVYSGIIVETEAYTQDDPACHAFRGRTPRSATLFGKPGLAYVYFIYGMYYCLNFVTEPENTAGAVLIRALEPIPPLANTNGPGKLCRALGIDRELNEADVTDKKSGLWVERCLEIPPEKVVTTGRIGIKVATDCPWRFYIADNPFVSKAKPLKTML